MLAVSAPVGKLTVIAAATLGVALFVHHPQAAPQGAYHHRLTLVAPFQDNAIYLTAFAEDRIESSPGQEKSIDITTTTSELPPLTFTTRAHVFDGCVWEGTEHLVPVNAHEYSYSYEEEILSCAPGAQPTIKTPRTGTVIVSE